LLLIGHGESGGDVARDDEKQRLETSRLEIGVLAKDLLELLLQRPVLVETVQSRKETRAAETFRAGRAIERQQLIDGHALRQPVAMIAPVLVPAM
jgi:hypothetical protein